MFENSVKKKNLIFIISLTLMGILFLIFFRRAPDINFKELKLYDENRKESRMDFSPAPHTLVVFVTSWCPNCAHEIQELDAFFRNNSCNVQLYFITDEKGEKFQLLKERLQQTSLSYRLYATELKLNELNIQIIPTNYLVNSEGRIEKKQTGELNPHAFLPCSENVK